MIISLTHVDVHEQLVLLGYLTRYPFLESTTSSRQFEVRLPTHCSSGEEGTIGPPRRRLRHVLHWVFVGQACQSKAETFLFPFFESKCPIAQPIQRFLSNLQFQAWCNALDADENGADWLLGGTYR